jgi:hypothetical protein
VAFLTDIGWGSRIIKFRTQAKKVKKILTKEQLQMCQELIRDIRLEVHKSGKDPLTEFAKYKDPQL